MSVENIKKFYEDLAKNEKLKEKAQKLKSEMNLPKNASNYEINSAIVSIAEKLGYSFSKSELEEYPSNLEMSSDVLEEVSGGLNRSCGFFMSDI